jgi:hypothetical protein
LEGQGTIALVNSLLGIALGYGLAMFVWWMAQKRHTDTTQVGASADFEWHGGGNTFFIETKTGTRFAIEVEDDVIEGGVIEPHGDVEEEQVELTPEGPQWARRSSSRNPSGRGG